ncbi:RidA family protein [Streptomyces sp. NPDC056948]|uniref:RidA family protein n=1 Tax=Streptomyces sp. NPDC056948 TaxID=3345975 RepID=UPI003627E674
MRNYESDDHPYSEVRLDNGIAYVSGILPYDTDGTIIQDRDRAPEAVISQLAKRLDGVGLTLNDVVKTTVFVTDISWRDDTNRAYLAAFTSPMPARTVVEVRNLPRDAPIEVEAVAHR